LLHDCKDDLSGKVHGMRGKSVSLNFNAGKTMGCTQHFRRTYAPGTSAAERSARGLSALQKWKFY